MLWEPVLSVSLERSDFVLMERGYTLGGFLSKSTIIFYFHCSKIHTGLTILAIFKCIALWY